MIEETQPGYWKGKYLSFEDKGKATPKAKTRLYQVSGRGDLLGMVKWMVYWRKYAFFTNNIVLDDSCMAELIEFIKARTEEQRIDWKKQSIVDWDLYNSTKSTQV